MRTDKPFMIGEWKVEPDLDRIVRGTERRALRPQVMSLLVYLAARGGSVAKSEKLLQDLWPNKIVTDATLYNCIAELRRLLDDGRGNRRYVETVHKKGYRLREPVTTLADSGERTEQKSTGNPEAEKALLLGNQRLNRRNLEGWKQAESYFRRAVQLDPDCSGAWQKLAESIVVQFSTFEISPHQLHEALAAAERAIELDDQNGLAWISKARAEAAIATAEDRVASSRPLLRMYERALELLPESAEVLREFGLFLIRLPGKAQTAVSHLKASVRLDPLTADNHFALGQAYRLVGRSSDALAALRRACELQPDNPYPIWDIGLTYYHMGSLAEALYWGSKAFKFERDDPSGPFLLAHVAMNLGRLSLAEKWIRRGMTFAPDAPISLATLMALAHAKGQPEKVPKLANQIIPYSGEMRIVHPGAVAQALWVLRDRDIERGRPEIALDRYQRVVPDLFDNSSLDESIWLVAAVDVAYLFRVVGDEKRARRLLENVRTHAATKLPAEREIDNQWLLLEATLMLGDRRGAERMLRNLLKTSWIRWWHYLKTRPTVDAIRDSRAFGDATAAIETHRDREWARFKLMVKEDEA